MVEHIYTIPLNDAFDKAEGCPFCAIKSMLEEREVETITGASMMEPSVRIKTNEQGFCAAHFDQMLKVGKKLPVALIMQSHLETIDAKLQTSKPDKLEKYLSALGDSCYVCSRVSYNMLNVYDNFFDMWGNDPSFRKKVEQQQYFCLPHFQKMLMYGQKFLSKKDFAAFYDVVGSIEKKHFQTLMGDVDWFCKKFDYRFKEESWKNSKDAVERSVQAISSVYPVGKNGISTTEG